MNYKITLMIEDEDEFPIFTISTNAGMADFEENIVRKAEHAIKDYESKMEVGMQNEIDRQAEEAEDVNLADTMQHND